MSYHIHVICRYTTHAHAHARTFSCMRALSCHHGNTLFNTSHKEMTNGQCLTCSLLHLLVMCCGAPISNVLLVVSCGAVMVNVLFTQHSSMSHIHTHTIWVVCSLQHTEAHCNTLRHTATRCYTLQYTATICTKLQHTQTEPGYSAHCNTLQHTAKFETPCITLQYTWAEFS